MNKFEKESSTLVPLLQDHVDTDQIIPARFLKTTVKTGIGDHLFKDWRFSKNQEKNEDFILNNPDYTGDFLLAGENFGCGSSREHAVWALLDYGFKAVIAKSFADIFKLNSLNNGLLPIEVSEDFWGKLLTASKKNQKITIDLPNQYVLIDESGDKENFYIDPFRKTCIINGYTDLDYLLSIQDKINEFVNTHPIPEIQFE